MPEPSSIIAEVMKEQCNICAKPDEIVYRLGQTEENVKVLGDKFRISKMEIFNEMKENKKEVESQLRKLNNLLIGTLSTGIVTLLVLLVNIVSKR